MDNLENKAVDCNYLDAAIKYINIDDTLYHYLPTGIQKCVDVVDIITKNNITTDALQQLILHIQKEIDGRDN